MSKTKSRGDAGEEYIVDNVPCPNCGKPLQGLPRNYPLYDVQCTGCVFRAQVKTAHSKPKNTVFGAGWGIMSKVLKSGFLVPPLIVQFIWTVNRQHQRSIRFFPFVPKSNLKNYRLSEHARQADYAMFVYADLLTLPGFLFERGGWRVAQLVAPQLPSAKKAKAAKSKLALDESNEQRLRGGRRR
ncbi:MAG: hypothetical protein RL514_2292 [Verrucomicrobiota bacterium]|jgi:hypothetical protein